MSVLQTKVLPIEYDSKTKEKARRIKKVLEKNPEFFREFLQGEKLSCIDENCPLYIEKGQSILKYLDGISAYDATGFLRENYLKPNQELQVLDYLISEGDWSSNIKSDHGKILRTYAFFHEKKDYKELKRYIQDTSIITQEDINLWLKEKYRYQISECLLESILLVIQEGYVNHINQDIEEALDTLIYLSDELSTLVDYNAKEQTIDYLVTPIESQALFREFLAVIDSSLHLLKIANEIEEANKIINDPNDERICDSVEIRKNSLSSYSLYGNDGKKYLYIPWKYTIEDSVSLVHEFFHYIADEKNSIYTEGSILSEFPSTFFETLMCQFLISKNYPKEEVDKVLFRRKLFTTTAAINCKEICVLLKQVLKNTPINRENEIAFLQQEGDLTEEDSYELSCELADLNCDERNLEMLENSYLCLELILYLLGYKYTEIALNKLENNINIIPNMIYLAENLEQIPIKKALENAEIIEKSPQKTKK